MKPEDNFRRMQDKSRWNVAPLALRTHPESRPAIVRRFVLPVVVIAAVTALFVGGVQTIRANAPASPPAPTVVPTSSPSSTPTASPTPTPTGTAIPTATTSAWTSPPTIAFDGDCDSLFTEAEVAGFLSVPKARLVKDDAWNSPANPLIAISPHNGALRCAWDDDTKVEADGTHPVLVLTVLSATAFPGRSSGMTGATGGQYSFTTGSNGYILGGTLYFNQNLTVTMDMPTVAQTAYTAISDAFPEVAAAQGPPPAPYSQRAGDWPASVSCSSLFSDAKVWSLLHRAKGTVEKRADNGQPSDMQNELVAGHGLTACQTGDQGDYLLVEAMAAGSWLKSEITGLTNVHSVQVGGADSAWAYTLAGEEGTVTYLYAIDGPNLLVILTSGDSVNTALPAAPGLLAELDKKAATSATSPPVITTAGWGDLKLGKPVPSGTKLVTWKTVDPDQCMGNPGYWDLPGHPGEVAVRTAGNSRTGQLQAISFLDPTIKTKSGAHVGMSLADVKKLLPNAKAEKGGTLYVVSDALGQVVFDVGDKNANEYYPGPAAKNVVLLIHVLPTSTAPFSNQHSEFGPCA